MASWTNDGDAVASLEMRHRFHGNTTFSILRNHQFDFGRRQIQATLGVNEPTISTHHLRFHCVVFEWGDEDKDALAAPLIYVQVLSSNKVALSRSDLNHLSSDVLLSRASGDVLLDDGDELQLNPNISVQLKLHVRRPRHNILSLDQRLEARQFAGEYALTDRLLGTGGQGSILVAVKNSTKRQFACKVVPTKRTSQRLRGQDEYILSARAMHERLEPLTREFVVLRDLSHPNIIKLEKVFCMSYNIFIIQELVTGGDLLSYIELKGALSEPESIAITYQVLKAVEYLHDHGVAHRDIKPENLLVTSWRAGGRVVLTDFGQARVVGVAREQSAVSRMMSSVGTVGYMAPEIYRAARDIPTPGAGYTTAIDIWSVGCLVGILLTSHPMPFQDGDEEQVDWSLDFIEDCPSWRTVSCAAKSFVRACLAQDENLRLTAKSALLHDWMANKHYVDDLVEAYKRAVQDWKPQPVTERQIVHINTADIVLQGQPVRKMANEVASRHFAMPQASGLPPSILGGASSRSVKSTTPLPPIGELCSSPPSSSYITAEQAALLASPLEGPPPFTHLHPAAPITRYCADDFEKMRAFGKFTKSMPATLSDS